MNLVYMTIVFESPYCNDYGTDYQLRYVYRNNGSGIAVEYITGTSNLYQIWGRHMGSLVYSLIKLWWH
jgi:hypothetical protein